MAPRGRKKLSKNDDESASEETVVTTRSMMTRRSQTRQPTKCDEESSATPTAKRVRVEKKDVEEAIPIPSAEEVEVEPKTEECSVSVVPQTTTIKLVDPPPSEVFLAATEANLIAEANQRIQSASSSNVLTDPLGQDTSSDSSDSDDPHTDDYNDDSGSGGKKPKLKSVNGHHRTGTANGVLNKSKIDTEFIAKLIPNKDPNDKRYDLNEINKLRLLSHSYQNFSVKLLTRLFDEEEIIGRNVYGRNYSGDKSATKQPLDPERINFIKETVLRLTKTNNPELAWASCVIAMNRKMVDINNKYAKLKQNST